MGFWATSFREQIDILPSGQYLYPDLSGQNLTEDGKMVADIGFGTSPLCLPAVLNRMLVLRGVSPLAPAKAL
jgi:hypothetical protein